jgi:hypothetical protein
MNSQSLRNARSVSLLSAVGRVGRIAIASSTVGRWVQDIAEQTTDIARQSRFGATIRWGGRAARASWCYRWLTTEPEADVVVIDIRETAVVGPILALVDRLLGPLVQHWRGARTGTVVTGLSERFVDRPVQLISIAALVAILTNLFLLVALGSPSPSTVGAGLLAASVALAGTRVTRSADELARTDVYELAVKLLAPPEPPERDEQNDGPRE